MIEYTPQCCKLTQLWGGRDPVRDRDVFLSMTCPECDQRWTQVLGWWVHEEDKGNVIPIMKVEQRPDGLLYKRGHIWFTPLGNTFVETDRYLRKYT